MKQLTTIIGSAIIGGSAVLGATFGAVDVKPDPIILADNIEQHTRLKQLPVWDTSVVTSEEITQAYIDVGKKYGVTKADLDAAESNLQVAIQTKMAAQLLICDNPNTNKL